MARRKDDRDRPAAREEHDGSAAAATGPRTFIVEEEQLSDGRYILYYGWAPAEPPAQPARKARAPRTAGR